MNQRIPRVHRPALQTSRRFPFSLHRPVANNGGKSTAKLNSLLCAASSLRTVFADRDVVMRAALVRMHQRPAVV